jgi:hypothetical protein
LLNLFVLPALAERFVRGPAADGAPVPAVGHATEV